MSTEIDTLQIIPEGKPVRIFLPLQTALERIKAHCIFEKGDGPIFKLVFKAGQLPADDLNLEQPCIITIDMGGPPITLEAMIRKVVNPQTLEMIIQKSISHEQMREYFRVDAVLPVIIRPYFNELIEEPNETWSLKGKTVDISGSGIRAQFEREPPEEEQIIVEIVIPAVNSTTVQALARPVRTHLTPTGLYEVAYHFDDISTEDRDAIIGCCLIVQRRMLRLKVQVREK